MSSPRMLLPASGTLPPGAPLSVHHQIQLLQQQLQQQQQQTQVAVAQVHPSQMQTIFAFETVAYGMHQHA